MVIEENMNTGILAHLILIECYHISNRTNVRNVVLSMKSRGVLRETISNEQFNDAVTTLFRGGLVIPVPFKESGTNLFITENGKKQVLNYSVSHNISTLNELSCITEEISNKYPISCIAQNVFDEYTLIETKHKDEIETDEVTKNPYQEGTPAYVAWALGWTHKEQSKEKKTEVQPMKPNGTLYLDRSVIPENKVLTSFTWNGVQVRENVLNESVGGAIANAMKDAVVNITADLTTDLVGDKVLGQTVNKVTSALVHGAFNKIFGNKFGVYPVDMANISNIIEKTMNTKGYVDVKRPPLKNGSARISFYDDAKASRFPKAYGDMSSSTFFYQRTDKHINEATNPQKQEQLALIKNLKGVYTKNVNYINSIARLIKFIQAKPKTQYGEDLVKQYDAIKKLFGSSNHDI